MTSRPELIEFYEHNVKPQVDEFLKEKGLPLLDVWQQVATEAAAEAQYSKIKLKQGPTETLSHEEYLRRRAAGDSHESPSFRWAMAEIDRLREIEAREVAVVNLFTAIVGFVDGKITEQQFFDVIASKDQVLCQAVTALLRRDKIWKLEGALAEARLLEGMAARCFSEHLGEWLTKEAVQLRVAALVAELADARAGK